jgi:hypothetical protein
MFWISYIAFFPLLIVCIAIVWAPELVCIEDEVCPEDVQSWVQMVILSMIV